MQKPISDKIQLSQTLNPLHDYGGVPSINDEGTLENLITKVDKVSGFVATGKADGDLSRYYPNILPITRQTQIAGELPRKSYANITYSDKKQLEFVLDLTANIYSNYSTMEICLPLKFTKKTSKAQQMDLNIMTVNNFFGHWFTDTDIRHYPDDMMILSTNNSVSIANYSNAQMKQNKSYQHTTICNTYDLELASKFIQSIKFENTSSTYSLTGKLRYGFEREDDKHLLY